jgi:hypothetical protein
MVNAPSQADESNKNISESNKESDQNAWKSTPLIRMEDPEGATYGRSRGGKGNAYASSD